MKAIGVGKLKDMLEQGENFVLLDVREPVEVAVARIDPHLHIPMGELPMRTAELDRNTPVVVMCHHGVRSSRVCYYLERRGFVAINLLGGIDAWSKEVDPDVPLY